MGPSSTNKELVKRFNLEFIEKGDMSAFQEIISPDFLNQTAPPGVPKGPEGILYYFNQMLRPAFPDLHVLIHDQVAEGDKVTTFKSFQGTHRGEFMGLPPTGRKIVMDIIDIIRIQNGKFVEHWNVLDWGHVMSQLTSPVSEN